MNSGGFNGVNSWQYNAGGSKKPITGLNGINKTAAMNNMLAQAMGGMGGANGVTWDDILRKTMAMQVQICVKQYHTHTFSYNDI